MNHPRVVGVERDMKMIEGRVEVSSFRVPHHLEGRRRLLVWRACFGTRQFFESALETLEIAVWPEAPVRQWSSVCRPGCGTSSPGATISARPWPGPIIETPRDTRTESCRSESQCLQ